jgi:aryl-alcohol dehydrogenase-like predicted oxidoreductase
MEYRRLGSAGLKVSELSFGSWVTFKGQLDDAHAVEKMKLAYDSGVNFFDNAEVYAGGEAEAIMGRALKKLSWRRASYVISTKFFWGLHEEGYPQPEVSHASDRWIVAASAARSC